MTRETITLPPGSWLHPEGQRVSGLPESEQGFLAKRLLGLTRRRAASTSNLNVFTVLVRLGGIFLPYLLFLSQLLMSGRIPRVDKELIILRVAWRIGCVYEWGHHYEMARELGLGANEILSVAKPDNPEWDERLRALLHATDELLAARAISGGTWQTLRKYLSEDQAVEFCMLVGHYIMVAGTINSTGVALEPGYLKDTDR